MTKLLLFLTISLLLLAGSIALGESLWQADSDSLFADRKAHRVGDLITVLIAESSTARHEAKTQNDKKWSDKGGPGSGLVRLFPDFSVSAEREASGSGSSVRTTSVVDRVTAKVTEILPSGALRIEGERVVDLSPDKMKLSITGLVRPEDLASENIVSSTRVAELKITSSGKGPIADTRKPGLVSRILRWIW